MELQSYAPAWDLQSSDPFCLSVLTLLKFSKAECTVIQASTPSASPSGNLPSLRSGGVTVHGYPRVMSFLSQMTGDLDAELSEKERSDITAYRSLVECVLYDAQLHSWWNDADNARIVTSHLQATMPFISRVFYLNNGRIKDEVNKRLRGRYSGDLSKIIYTKARAAYRALSEYLGDKKFFFGSKPSSLDCVVFGHVALQLYPSLHNRKLQAMVNFEAPNLVGFCDRIRDLWEDTGDLTFVSDSSRYPTVRELLSSMHFFGRKEIKALGEKPKEEREFEWNRNLSMAGAVLAMVGYTWWNGIIQISSSDEGDDQEDEELYHDVDEGDE